MKSKIAIVLTLLLCFSLVFGIAVFANDESVETPAKPTYTVEIKYTDDSSTLKGISYEAYVDPATFEVGLEIVEDLPFGHVIYDDPETPYIDGIRINGNTVNSLKVALDDSTVYMVDVRTVYEDNLLGDLAKIVDGNFDFKTLLENPIMLLMGVYYALSIMSIVVAALSAAFSKSKKVKNADEIAQKVSESSDKAVAQVRTEVTDTVLAEVTPILQRIMDGLQNVITAVTLSTSRTKEAPLAMLDALQKSAEASDVVKLMEDIRKVVSDGIVKSEAIHDANVETLHEIAKSVEPLDTSLEAPKPSSTNKSVF